MGTLLGWAARRIVLLVAVGATPALSVAPALAHTGGGKVAALVWREHGDVGGFTAQVKVWNYTDQKRRVRLTAEIEGTYTVEKEVTVCDSFGCYTYTDYETGSIIRRVSRSVRVPAFGTNRKHIAGFWTLPAGASLDYVFADIVHAHVRG